MCFFYADMTCLYFVLLLFISSVRLAFAPSSHLSLSRSLSFRLHLSSSFSLSLSFSLCPVHTHTHTHCIAVSVFVIRWVFWGSYTKDQRELRSHCFQQRCCIARHTEENHKGFWKWCFTWQNNLKTFTFAALHLRCFRLVGPVFRNQMHYSPLISNLPRFFHTCQTWLTHYTPSLYVDKHCKIKYFQNQFDDLMNNKFKSVLRMPCVIRLLLGLYSDCMTLKHLEKKYNNNII